MQGDSLVTTCFESKVLEIKLRSLCGSCLAGAVKHGHKLYTRQVHKPHRCTVQVCSINSTVRCGCVGLTVRLSVGMSTAVMQTATQQHFRGFVLRYSMQRLHSIAQRAYFIAVQVATVNLGHCPCWQSTLYHFYKYRVVTLSDPSAGHCRGLPYRIQLI